MPLYTGWDVQPADWPDIKEFVEKVYNFLSKLSAGLYYYKNSFLFILN